MLYIDEIGSERLNCPTFEKEQAECLKEMLHEVKHRNKLLGAVRFVKRYNLMDDKEIRKVLTSRLECEKLKDKILLEGRAIKRLKNGTN
jgi:hypothetical protein